MPGIKILPPEEARKIAAGEVIDRPSALMREFMDNSLDASASLIEVSIEGGGIIRTEVSDDGEGIRENEIRKAAGVKDSEDIGILDIITRPGFSIRRTATTISGRGVGLDVVRSLVTGDLGGKLNLETKPEGGTAFTITFSDRTVRHPAFPVTVGGKLLLAPRVMVERIFPLSSAKISGHKRFSCTLGGTLYPVQLFSGQDSPDGGKQGILVRAGGEAFVIAAASVEEEKLYSLAELVPSVSVLLARDF